MTKPRMVDFLNEKTDLQVLVLGQLGLSTTAIMTRTGLSHGQVLYRLGKGNVHRSDYRNGTSPTMTLVLDRTQRILAQRLREQLAPTVSRKRA